MCYVGYLRDCKDLLWSISNLSRKYIKENYQQIINRIIKKKKLMDLDITDVYYHNYLIKEGMIDNNFVNLVICKSENIA